MRLARWTSRRNHRVCAAVCALPFAVCLFNSCGETASDEWPCGAGSGRILNPDLRYPEHAVLPPRENGDCDQPISVDRLCPYLRSDPNEYEWCGSAGGEPASCNLGGSSAAACMRDAIDDGCRPAAMLLLRGNESTSESWVYFISETWSGCRLHGTYMNANSRVRHEYSGCLLPDFEGSCPSHRDCAWSDATQECQTVF